MVDLGTLGGSSSQANAVNDSGQVVGSSYTRHGTIHAFSWTQRAGWSTSARSAARSAANAVNDSGQVVGAATSPATPHAFSWTQTGGMVDLGTLGGELQRRPRGEQQRPGGRRAATAGDPPSHAFSWTQAGG